MAVPVISPVGVVSFKLAWVRCGKVWKWFRGTPRSRARRAVGSPLALPGFLEDRPCQQGIVPLAGPTPVGRKVLLCTEQEHFGVPTARAD